ncbi:MAG: hypothetical protein MJE77_31670 [Proteobacteria bacterium]|nr:hypothetical protein [Pseudomonadota bacterium]
MRSFQRRLLYTLTVAVAFLIAYTKLASRDSLDQFAVCQAILLKTADGCPPDECGAPLEMVGDDPVEIASGEIIIHSQDQTLRGGDVVASALPFVSQSGQTGELVIEEYDSTEASEHWYRLTGVPGADPTAENWYRVSCAIASAAAE